MTVFETSSGIPGDEGTPKVSVPLGKVIGGGAPIGLFGGREDISSDQQPAVLIDGAQSVRLFFSRIRVGVFHH